MNEFYQKGQKEASVDLEANKLKIKTLGRPVSWFQEWREILLNEYNIDIVRIAGCLVSDEEIDYLNGYNSVSEPEIKKRFGENVFKDTLEQAESVCKLEPYYPKPFENNNEEMTVTSNSFGWVKCPNCNISFKIYSTSWNGKIHLSCRQKLKIFENK